MSGLVKKPNPRKINVFNRDYILEGNDEIKIMREYRRILTQYVTGFSLNDVKIEWFNNYKNKLLTLMRPSESELIELPKQKTKPQVEDIKINKIQINLPFSAKLDNKKVKNQVINNMDKILDDYVKSLIRKLPKQLNYEGRNKIFEDNIIWIKNFGDEDLAELITELWLVWVNKVKSVKQQQDQKQKKSVLEIPEEIKLQKVVFKEQPREPKQRPKTDKFLYEAPPDLTIEYPYVGNLGK